MALAPQSSTNPNISHAHGDFTDVPQPTPPRWRLALIRGIIWSLHGMIYAPLFTGLKELLKGFGLDVFAYLIAAALTGAIGAVLYGARELSLISSGLGAGIGVISLILLTDQLTFVHTILIAIAIAAVLGLIMRFPDRCSANVAPKALAGLVAGAISGMLLLLGAFLHDAPFSLFAVLAFLVSLNGVLYVATVRRWVALTQRICRTSLSCNLVEAGIMALLAGVAAGSVWMISGPLINQDAGLWWLAASLEMHQQIPQAVLGGLLGGGVAGMFLEAFRFTWVDDL